MCALPRYLRPVSWTGGELVVRVLVRRHAVVVGLVVLLAVPAMPDRHALQDDLHVVWMKDTERSRGFISALRCSASSSSDNETLTFGTGS